MTTVDKATELLDSTREWFGPRQGPVFKAAVLLLVGLGHRKHLDDLTKMTGYDRDFVKSCLHNMRKAGIWKGEDKMTYAQWPVEPLAFLLDAMVAAGVINRAGQDTQGRDLYIHPAHLLPKQV